MANPIKSRKTHQKRMIMQNTMIITRGRKMISMILLHLRQQSTRITSPTTAPTMAAITVAMIFPVVGGVSVYTKKQA